MTYKPKEYYRIKITLNPIILEASSVGDAYIKADEILKERLSEFIKKKKHTIVYY